MRRWLELLLFGTAPLLALAAAPMLARGLGPNGRGEFAVVLAVFTLASAVGNFGQAERFSAALRMQPSAHRSPGYVVVAAASTIAAIIAYLAMTALGVGVATSFVVSVTVPLSSIGLMWRSIAVSRGRVLLLAVQPAAPAVLRLCLLAILFLFATLTTFSATATTMLSTAVGVLLLLGALHKKETGQERSILSKDHAFSFAEVKLAATQGLPVVGFTLCTAVMLRLDVFVLSALSTPEQVGYYAAVVAVTESALALSGAFRNRIQAATYTERPIANVRRELAIMVGISLPVAIIGSLCAHPFTVAMFGRAFEPAVPALRVLVFAAVALMLVDSGQGLLAVLGRRRAMLYTSGAGAAITVLALWVLVPRFGALGAATASLFAYTVVAATSWVVASTTLKRE